MVAVPIIRPRIGVADRDRNRSRELFWPSTMPRNAAVVLEEFLKVLVPIREDCWLYDFHAGVPGMEYINSGVGATRLPE